MTTPSFLVGPPLGDGPSQENDDRKERAMNVNQERPEPGALVHVSLWRAGNQMRWSIRAGQSDDDVLVAARRVLEAVAAVESELSARYGRGRPRAVS